MQLTADLVLQAVFFAAMLALILGLGKAMATVAIMLDYFRKEKLPKNERKKKMKAVTPDIFQAMIEAIVGIAIIGFFIITGLLDAGSYPFISILLAILFIPLLLLFVLAKRWE
jgi:amino acid transporter